MSKEFDTKDFDTKDFDTKDFDEELEVRAPDPVIKERLCEPNYYANYNTEYDLAQNTDFVQTTDAEIAIILKQSLLDFELAEEQKIKDLIALKRAEQLQKYSNIKKRLQKVQGFDVKNKETYNIIISIFDLYETDFIDTYALDESSYTNVFKLLSTIRLTKEELELLHELIYPPFYKR
jgi:hypothetical protein